jgi:acetoin utilization deacetylase AcuC-like enzyme
MGYASETGTGTGEGFNVNLPMPRGTAWADYGVALAAAIARVRAFAPDVLVVSLGVDTYKDDPVGGFRLETADYPRIGAAIAALRLPTHFVMEGGYAMAALGGNVAGVLAGFEDG